MSKKLTAEAVAIQESKSEVALTRKLLDLLRMPGVSVFFEVHQDRNWDAMHALDAWEMWLHDQLSLAEMEMYRATYGDEVLDICELRRQLAIDSNRVPGPGNVDGF